MYKTILVPHAGTPAGDEALKHAIFIAKASSAKIILLHVVEEMSRPAMFALASSERERLLKNIGDANEVLRKEMETEMEKRKKRCEDSNIKAELKVAIGNAAEIILNMIKEQKIDLIVMSKRLKLKGVKKLLSLGSVSRKVTENVSCPVLLIDIENL